MRPDKCVHYRNKSRTKLEKLKSKIPLFEDWIARVTFSIVQVSISGSMMLVLLFAVDETLLIGNPLKLPVGVNGRARLINRVYEKVAN